ncbi:hypothetical protein C0Q70_21324 [Pomacea canaliculata]|uniref:Uncharacterized protein n=1 Tax=Pomacea canaliculata TaxID=400727 RepID=A0A2T7NCA8_POMCA|nr:hypothetical protein C0Q70_21324 [Pomacea canaliculata]
MRLLVISRHQVAGLWMDILPHSSSLRAVLPQIHVIREDAYLLHSAALVPVSQVNCSSGNYTNIVRSAFHNICSNSICMLAACTALATRTTTLPTNELSAHSWLTLCFHDDSLASFCTLAAGPEGEKVPTLYSFRCQDAAISSEINIHPHSIYPPSIHPPSIYPHFMHPHSIHPPIIHPPSIYPRTFSRFNDLGFEKLLSSWPDVASSAAATISKK